MTFAKKALILSAAGAVTAGLAVPVIAQSNSISGAGASFPAPAYQRWSVEFAKQTKRQVNYQSVGSGAGVRQFHAGSVDFGATDEELSESKGEFTKGVTAQRGALQIPMMGGTVTPAYNNPSCKNLKLTQRQVADIFLGKIKTWEQLKCGKGPIAVVHRSDGSGTTAAFTNSLSCFSSEWKSKVGTSKAVKWPVGVGGKGNEGVAGLILNTPGSLGYLNQAFVKGKITPAALQNKAGKFVLANDTTGAAALNGVKLNARLGGEDCNPAGANAFPIATFTWILAYQRGNGDKASTLRQFLTWGLSPKGQGIAKQLDFVPLTGAVLARARAEVAKIGK